MCMCVLWACAHVHTRTHKHTLTVMSFSILCVCVFVSVSCECLSVCVWFVYRLYSPCTCMCMYVRVSVMCMLCLCIQYMCACVCAFFVTLRFKGVCVYACALSYLFVLNQSPCTCLNWHLGLPVSTPTSKIHVLHISQRLSIKFGTICHLFSSPPVCLSVSFSGSPTRRTCTPNISIIPTPTYSLIRCNCASIPLSPWERMSDLANPCNHILYQLPA